MSSYFKEDYYASGESVDLSEKNFRMAISVEDYLAPIRQKNDHRYVKWQFRLWGKRDGQDFQRILPYHKCTDYDYAQFYPVARRSQVQL